MIAQLQLSVRHSFRAILHRTFAGAFVSRARRRRGTVATHETPAFWNDELSGRMAAPNLNGRISNELRDITTLALLRHCAPLPRRVLDVGCGFGDLSRALAGECLQRYVGVDLSDFAVERARRESAEWGLDHCELRFHRSDLREFAPGEAERFDVIVFNEVLKYVDVAQAVEQLERYAAWLAPDGVICVNLTDDAKNHQIFRRLAQRFEWKYGVVYQQQPVGPQFGLTRDRAMPAYHLGVLCPRRAA